MNMKRSITAITALLLGLFVSSLIAQESPVAGNTIDSPTLSIAAQKPAPEEEESQPKEET